MASAHIKSCFALKKKLVSPINQLPLDCKMLSVIMRHLNSLNYLSLGIDVLKYLSDYLTQPPGKPIHYEKYWNNPCSTRNRLNVARGTEVDIRWLKGDWTDAHWEWEYDSPGMGMWLKVDWTHAHWEWEYDSPGMGMCLIRNGEWCDSPRMYIFIGNAHSLHMVMISCRTFSCPPRSKHWNLFLKYFYLAK